MLALRRILRFAAASLGIASANCGARSGLDELTPSGAPSDPNFEPPRLRMLCPESSADPRLPGVAPEGFTQLDGAAFVQGMVTSYRWSVREEDCDAIVPRAGYLLDDAGSQRVRFRPARPGQYTLQLDVTGVAGDRGSCEFPLKVEGRGLRVELCWDTSTQTDLDLYLHTPFNQSPWFNPAASDLILGMNGDTCNTANCTPIPRFDLSPVDWGYPDSPLENCAAGPNGQLFQARGRCPNPRASDDNNQSISTGTTERIQLDNPGNGQRFTIMVQNFSNSPASPHVFVYCGAERVGELTPPAQPARFVAREPGIFGVMWRATHVYTEVNAAGTTACRLAPTSVGITIDNPNF